MMVGLKVRWTISVSGGCRSFDVEFAGAVGGMSKFRGFAASS